MNDFWFGFGFVSGYIGWLWCFNIKGRCVLFFMLFNFGYDVEDGFVLSFCMVEFDCWCIIVGWFSSL